MVVHLRWGRYRYGAGLCKEPHLVIGSSRSMFETRRVFGVVPVWYELVDG